MNYKVCQISSAHRRYDARIFRKVAVTLSNNGFESYFLVMDKKENELIDGVNIISNGKFIKNNALRVLLSSHLLKKIAIKINADLYQIHDPELFNLGFYLKKKGKKVIFDCHEDYRFITEKKYIPKFLRKIVLNIYLKKEKKACKEFNAIITVTPSVFNRLKPYSKKISIITNYPVVVKKIENKKLTEIPTICFGGNCGWLHQDLIKAIERFDGRIRYEFATNPLDPSIKEYKKMKGWKYVDFLGYLKFDQLTNIYKKSWIGFAVFPYCSVVNYNEGTLGNTKIFEYMMYGLPVICSDHKIWKDIIIKENCGLVVKPGDVNSLYDAINTLIQNKSKLIQLGENGRKAALKTYNWSTQEPILLALYEEILNEK